MIVLEQTAHDAIDEIANLDFDSLLPKDVDQRVFDFSEIISILNTIRDDLVLIQKNQKYFKTLVKRNQDQIRATVRSIKVELLTKIGAFKAYDNPNTTADFKGINDTARQLLDTHRERQSNLLLEAALHYSVEQNDIEGKTKEALAKFKNIDKKIEEASKLAESLEEQKKEIRSSLGAKAAEISATNFSEQAGIHEKLSSKWLKASMVSIGILGLYLLYLLSPLAQNTFPEGMDDFTRNYFVIRVLILRFLALSTFYYVLHQCIKNYKINNHLAVSNEHRHHSLQVFPLLLKSAEDQETRMVIASAAAKSILEPVNTGYLGDDDDPRPVSPTAIINKIVEQKERG